MAGLTLQQLQAMGAKPAPAKQGLTLDQLKSQSGFPKGTPPEVHKNFWDKLASFGQGAQDLAVGAAKGVVSTVKGAADLGEGALNAVSNAVGVKDKNNMGQSTQIIPESTYTAKNKTEGVGKGLEQTAELFTPSGIEAKGLSLTARIAKGALEFGTKTAIQTGGDKKQTAVAAVTGGAGELVAAGVTKLLEKVPESAWNAILKRTASQVAKNPNLPEQAAATGMVGSRSGIIVQSENHIQQIETALDDLLGGSKQKIGTLKVAPYLDELRNSYKNIPGEQGSVDTINNVMSDLLKKKSLTPLEANQIKRDIYGLISKSYNKGTLEIPAKTEAQKMIARGLKTEIEKIIPEAKSLNQQQAVYIQVKKALEKLANRSEGKGIMGSGIGLNDLGVGGLTEIMGLATGHPAAGVVGIAAKKAAESTPVLSSASKLARYFDSLSPTKKLLFTKAIEGLTVKSTTSATK